MKGRKLSILLAIFLTSSGSSAIADSTENFLQGQISGFFDALVVTEISSSMDIVLFIIVPFLGMYGITLYLTRKALQMAEDNFAGNNSYGSAELGDQGKRTTQLISVAISAVAVSQFGGFAPVIAMILGLIGIAFLINNFYGAAQETRHTRNTEDDVETTIEQADELEHDIAEQEERTRQTGSEDDLHETDRELGELEEALEHEVEDIEDIEGAEEGDLETLLGRMEKLLKHRKLEVRALEGFREFHDKSRDFRASTLSGVNDSLLQEYENRFLDFYSNNRDLDGEDFMEEWLRSSKKHEMMTRNDIQSIEIGDLRNRFRNQNIYSGVEDLRNVLENIIKFEKGHMEELMRDREHLKEDLREQEEIFQATERFMQQLDTFREERANLEELHRQMDGISVDEMDHDRLETLKAHIRHMKDEQETIDRIAEHLEEMDDKEIDLTIRIENHSELHEKAQREFSSWILLHDLAIQRGQVGEGGQFKGKLTMTIHMLRLFNMYMSVVKSRIEDEENQERELEQIIEKIHTLADRNLRNLSG